MDWLRKTLYCATLLSSPLAGRKIIQNAIARIDVLRHLQILHKKYLPPKTVLAPISDTSEKLLRIPLIGQPDKLRFQFRGTTTNHIFQADCLCLGGKTKIPLGEIPLPDFFPILLFIL